jgi:DUF1680 family protein
MSDVPEFALQALPLGAVRLETGIDATRREATRRYVRSLKPENLLLNHKLEAGLIQINEKPEGIHWGWESPTSMVRSHFVGNWLSAMSYFWATTEDAWAKGLVDHVVDEMAACQQANGGEWLPGIPEKFLHWIKLGRAVWAPMYIVHRNMMGLFDAHRLTGNDRALELIINQCRWLTRFTDGMSDDALDDLLDWETGGMQEVIADLYGVTGAAEHRELLRRFDRRRLIEPLLKGEDVLTNMHANQTAQEIVAAARAYEVTGDARWREACEAYWRSAVAERGSYATGGHTFGEYWTPPMELAARLGSSNQEHCVVYHMSRLAEHLLRWTGDAQYADYLERNRYNGIFAQQHPETGMVAYYLPLGPGGRKDWSTPTDTFSCCLATSIQAGSQHGTKAVYTDGRNLTITQYVASTASWSVADTRVTLRVHTYEVPPEPGKADFDHGLPAHRPQAMLVDIDVTADQPLDFTLRLRLPWWLAAKPLVTIDGEAVDLAHAPGTFVGLPRTWTTNKIHLELPSALTAVPLPDRPDTVAFMDGPVVLAGLVDERRTLSGDIDDPTGMLEPVGEFEFGAWQRPWMTTGQPADFRLIPLHEVTDETYTVYFPVRR